MLMTKRARLYSLLAALCFAVVGVYTVINDLRWMLTIPFSEVVYWGIMFGFAISLVLEKKIPVLIFFIIEGLYAAWDFWFNIRYGIQGISLFWFIADITGVVVLILALNKKKIVRIIWFLPAVFLLMVYLPVLHGTATSQYALMATVLVSSYLFTGLWVKADTSVALAEAVAKFQQTVHATSSETDTVDRLLELKELLDIGALTKEEFDEKKKQLLEM